MPPFEPQDLHVLLVGDGPARSEVERAIQQHGIAVRVTLTGFRPPEEALRYLAAFDVGLMPDSNAHGSPMKIFEYMAMGKCIVAPAQENIIEILDDGVNAMLFRPGDREDMKRVIWRAIAAREVSKAIGRKARGTLEEKGYFWRNNAAYLRGYLLPRI